MTKPIKQTINIEVTDVFVDFVQRIAMHQLVSDITRLNLNNPKGTCIDLVITSEILAISDLSISTYFRLIFFSYLESDLLFAMNCIQARELMKGQNLSKFKMFGYQSS